MPVPVPSPAGGARGWGAGLYGHEGVPLWPQDGQDVKERKSKRCVPCVALAPVPVARHPGGGIQVRSCDRWRGSAAAREGRGRGAVTG